MVGCIASLKGKENPCSLCSALQSGSVACTTLLPHVKTRPYGLFRCASQVLTQVSMRGLKLSSLIERKKWEDFAALDNLYTSVSMIPALGVASRPTRMRQR